MMDDFLHTEAWSRCPEAHIPPHTKLVMESHQLKLAEQSTEEAECHAMAQAEEATRKAIRLASAPTPPPAAEAPAATGQETAAADVSASQVKLDQAAEEAARSAMMDVADAAGVVPVDGDGSQKETSDRNSEKKKEDLGPAGLEVGDLVRISVKRSKEKLDGRIGTVVKLLKSKVCHKDKIQSPPNYGHYYYYHFLLSVGHCLSPNIIGNLTLVQRKHDAHMREAKVALHDGPKKDAAPVDVDRKNLTIVKSVHGTDSDASGDAGTSSNIQAALTKSAAVAEPAPALAQEAEREALADTLFEDKALAVASDDD